MHIIPFLPCPLCGTEITVIEHKRSPVYTIECPQCGIEFGHPYGYSSRLDLAHDWNKRTPVEINNG